MWTETTRKDLMKMGPQSNGFGDDISYIFETSFVSHLLSTY